MKEHAVEINRATKEFEFHSTRFSLVVDWTVERKLPECAVPRIMEIARRRKTPAWSLGRFSFQVILSIAVTELKSGYWFIDVAHFLHPLASATKKNLRYPRAV